MMTVNTELPPIAKISLIAIWVETVLYGTCVMYGLSMFFLLRGKTAALRWVLIVTSTLLSFLGTIHVGASLQQLLDAFVYAPEDVPDYSTTYSLNYTTVPRVLKAIVYATSVFVEYFILTWRLYVVFMFDWRILVFPILLTVGGTVGFAFSAASAFSNDGLYGSIDTSLKFVIPAWVFGCLQNLSVTAAIVARLWWMDRTMASLTGTSANRFASSIHIVVESGAIAVTYSIVLLALFASMSPAWPSSLDVVAQLVVLTPLLIVVQVGRTGDSSKTMSRTLDQIRFRVRVSIEQDLSQDLALDTTLARSLACRALPMIYVSDGVLTDAAGGLSRI
ncbi:hypothetical protein V8E55_005972 [Tylopilus felleus]